jgi:hypothetical protein
MNGGEKKELDERVDKGGGWEMAGVRVGDHRRLRGMKKKVTATLVDCGVGRKKATATFSLVLYMHRY